MTRRPTTVWRSPERLVPMILFSLAAILIVLSIYLVWRFGNAAYFAITGRPWGWPREGTKAAVTTSAPTFQTAQAISQTTSNNQTVEAITITATASTAIKAQIQAWITSPKNKQVWRSSATAYTNFPAGKPIMTTYSYQVPSGLSPGTYEVSFLINSTDGYSDYIVKNNFAAFTLP